MPVPTRLNPPSPPMGMQITYMGNSFMGKVNMITIIKLPLFSERQFPFIKAKIRRYFG